MDQVFFLMMKFCLNKTVLHLHHKFWVVPFKKHCFSLFYIFPYQSFPSFYSYRVKKVTQDSLECLERRVLGVTRACQASQDWKESRETKETLGSLVRLGCQMYPTLRTHTLDDGVLHDSLLCFFLHRSARHTWWKRYCRTFRVCRRNWSRRSTR